MINYLSIFQLLSILGYSALIIILALCPYKGEEFNTYHKVRRLLMSAMGVLIIQFIVQLIFGFRAKSPELGATCNMIFIMVVVQIVVMAIFKLLRRERSCRTEWIWTTVASVVNFIILMAGAEINDGVWMKYTVYASLFLYVLINFIFFYRALLEYKRIYSKMRQYYSLPIENHTTWIRALIISEIIICFMLPTILACNSMVMTLGVASYLCFVYFTGRLAYYGYYVRSVEHAEDDIAKDMQEDEAHVEYNLQYDSIEKALKEWIANDGYCEQGITLETLSIKIKACSRIVLSHYFRDRLNTNFRDWLNILRTDYGKNLIEEDPTLPIDYVADESGFSTRSYFDILFKERFNITPAQWRKQSAMASKKESE